MLCLPMDTTRSKAIEIIRQQDRIICTREALGQGIHRRMIVVAEN